MFGVFTKRNIIHSREAIVVDAQTRQVLYEKSSSIPVPVASLTKLMTYLIVAESIRDFSTRIYVDGQIIENLKERGASMSGLLPGYNYSVMDLLYCLMLPSGCDAAEVLASYFGMENFVHMMNERAQGLGMFSTKYVDSSGLGKGSEHNLSTSLEVSILFRILIKKPYFIQVVSSPTHSLVGMTNDGRTETHVVKNTNSLIDKESRYFNPYVIGGKTGTLSVAGRCLATLAQKDGRKIITVTLGIPGESSWRFDYHLTDTTKLISTVFS